MANKTLEQLASLTIPMNAQNVKKALQENQEMDDKLNMLIDTLRIGEPIISKYKYNVVMVNAFDTGYTYCTIDGTEPSMDNYQYSVLNGTAQYITIEKDAVFKAISYKEGRLPSYVTTFDFKYIVPEEFDFWCGGDAPDEWRFIGFDTDNMEDCYKQNYETEWQLVINDEHVVKEEFGIEGLETKTDEYGTIYYHIVFPKNCRSWLVKYSGMIDWHDTFEDRYLTEM